MIDLKDKRKEVYCKPLLVSYGSINIITGYNKVFGAKDSTGYDGACTDCPSR